MRFTERTDIAVRILTYLALLRGEKISIDLLVDRFIGHRSQVVAAVQELRKAGMIASTPGRHGGIWICRDPAKIKLAEVVRMFEADFYLTKCMRPEGVCPEEKCTLYDCCRFRHVLEDALVRFFQPFEETTVADLVSFDDPDQALSVTLAS
ncbi:RrF2 family transcriptional regulator [Roseibium sp.]|uniref:RrF2 family transcriptional regulator n=1 Tax=Roseibium sp. TaxID=1936156 RepID=UPI003A96AE20